jgi:transposase InsO family protein
VAISGLASEAWPSSLVNALAHLAGGLVGKGDGQNRVGRDAFFLDEPSNAAGDDAGFARPRPGKNQQRALGGLNGGALFGIQVGEERLQGESRREASFIQCIVTEPYTEPLAHAVESNRVWCADFKGWFRAGDGTRIDPLTITDACSRYLLRCQAVEKTCTERVRAIFEAAFREFGLPWWIRTDNGPPFASSAVGGLSRLAVWWIKLGIQPERIEAGHPEQNGRHERMHRTLKLDLRPAQDWRGQQRELDRFRHDYNQVRPHEALGMQTPASVYEPSPRPYPERLPDVEYPDTMQVRTVKSHGHFRWKKHDIFLSEVLWGERVGLLPVDDGIYSVYFAHMPVALFSERLLRMMPLNKMKGASGLSFLRHERSIVRWGFEAGPGAKQAAGPLPPSHRLDESQPVIPQRVALQQCPPPLHQPDSFSTPSAGNVNRNCAAENEKVSDMRPV